MPEYYFPPQQLFGELDSVYDTIHKLGGILYIPATHAGGVNQFVYPDATAPLVGTQQGTPTFDQSGLIPEILGGSPLATFTGAIDKVLWNVLAGDTLNMSAGGTWVYCLTPGSHTDVRSVSQKTSSGASSTRQGFGAFMRTTNTLTFSTSDNASTATIIDSPTSAFADGERFIFTFTLTPGGDGEIRKNCTSLATESGMQLPADFTAPMAVGNYVDNARQVNGPVDWWAQFPGIILTDSNCADIVALSGPLG